MVTKQEDAQPRSFKGVNFELLATGTRSMVTKMHYLAGVIVPYHSHPNEQAGYVVSGRYRLRLGNAEHVLQPGDSYVIPENETHSIEVLESGEVVDVFSPPREDYR